MKSTGASYNWYYTKEGGSGRRTAVFKKELYADHRCQLPVVFSAASGKNSLHRPRCVCFFLALPKKNPAQLPQVIYI